MADILGVILSWSFIILIVWSFIDQYKQKQKEESKKKELEHDNAFNIKALKMKLEALALEKCLKSGDGLLEKLNLSGLSQDELVIKILDYEDSKYKDKKNEYLNKIEKFYQEYNLRLGDIIKTILIFKKEILYKKTIQCQEFNTGKKFIKNDRNFQDYEDAKIAHDEFEELYAHVNRKQNNKIDLNEQDNKGLSQPFQPSTYYSNDKEYLKKQIKEREETIAKLRLEIDAILQDETYQTIAAIEDWDKYFDELKRQLTEEKERLEAENRAISEVSDEANRRYQGFDTEKISNKIDQVVPVIQKENSHYAKHIQSIQVPNFEKIRRYCNNLVDEHQADEMQEYLAENGRMHKAIIYDALEQFIFQLNGKTITVIDWRCAQGIASMLVIDYIREKQLDIKVEKIFLLDDNTTVMQRAYDNVSALKSNETNIYTTAIIPCPECFDEEVFNGIDYGVLSLLDNSSNDILLHLFANNSWLVDFYSYDWYDFDFKIYQGYFLCVSNQPNFVEDFDEHLLANIEGEFKNISSRDSKIGRFQRFERIFKLD